MIDETTQNITVMLKAWSDGDKNAADRLMPLVYDGLRRIAAQYLRKERPDHTFQPTANQGDLWTMRAGGKSKKFFIPRSICPRPSAKVGDLLRRNIDGYRRKNSAN